MRYLLFLLSAFLLAQPQFPDLSTRRAVTAWTVGEYPQITTDTPHNFEIGNNIYVIGFGSQFSMNGRKRVHSVIDSTNFTIENQDGSPLNTWGKKLDTGDNTTNHHIGARRNDVKEFAYVAKTQPVTMTAHPRGWFPKDPTLRARMTDPDGTGPGSAEALSTNLGTSLIAAANTFSDTNACNPSAPLSPTNCPKANYYLGTTNADVKYGYPVLDMATAWYAQKQNTRWRNYAIAYLNNFHKVLPQGRGFFTASDWTKALGGLGEDSDHNSLGIWFLVNAYTLMRSEMTEPERQAFAKKILNDFQDGCVNPAGEINSGKISGYARWGGDTNYLNRIEVSGNVATAFIRSSISGIATTHFITVGNATESSLNGTYQVTSFDTTNKRFTFNVSGVPDGTYNNTGLYIDDIYLSGDFAKVTDTSILSEGQKLLVRLFSFELSQSDVESIVVTGTSARINLKGNPRGSNITPVKIEGTGIENLDGSYGMVLTGVDYFTVTVQNVEPGTYSPSEGIRIYSNGANNRYNGNIIVKDILDSQHFRVTGTVGSWKADYGVVADWNENMCGLVTTSKSHTQVVNLDYRLFARLTSTVGVSDTELSFSNEFGSALEVLPTPFTLMIDSEMTTVTAVNVPRDNTSPAKATVIREAMGTIARPKNSNATIAITPGPVLSSMTHERSFWVGSPQNNLTITRSTLCTAYQILIDDLPGKVDEMEKWCNTYLMYHTMYPQEYWAGSTSSAANVGYHVGRQSRLITSLVQFTQNSIEEDYLVEPFWGDWLKDMGEWFMYMKFAYQNWHHSYSDSGNSRLYQARNIHPAWLIWKYPGVTSKQVNFFNFDTMGYLKTADGNYQQLPFQMAYNVDYGSDRIDYRTTLPLGKIFKNPTQSSRDNGRGLSTLHSRTSWTDPDATTVLGMNFSYSIDHTGRGTPGMFQMHKRAELNCQGGEGCVGGYGNTGMLIQGSSSLGSATGAYLKANGRVIITEPAPAGGVVVALTSPNQYVAVPAYVTVPEGETVATFPGWGYQNPTRQNVVISASSLNSRTGWVTSANGTGSITPGTTATISGITLSQSSVKAGHFIEATLTLASTAVAGVNISLSATGDLVVPPMVRVRSGQTTTQFPVSVPVGGAGGTITATSANVINQAVSVTSATPTQGNLVAITWGEYNNNYGVMPEFELSKLIRDSVGEDYTYWQVQGQQDEMRGAYCVTFTSSTGHCTQANLSHHHTSLIHIRPRTGQDFLISHTAARGPSREVDYPGYQRIFRINHYRGNGDPETPKIGEVVTSSPPDTGEVICSDISFVKHNTDRTRPGGASIVTKVLLPADPNKIQNEGIVNGGYGFRISLWGKDGKAEEGTDEFLLVQAAYAGENTTQPNAKILTGTTTNISGAFIDENPGYVAVFPIEGVTGETTLGFDIPATNAGTAFITSLAPGLWSITRAGISFLTNQCVTDEGVLRFSYPSGTASYSLSRTSATGCSQGQRWITSSLPPGFINNAYKVNLATSSGSPVISYTGTLPAGMTLSSAGVLSGTPTNSGAFSIDVSANDGSSTISRNFQLDISAAASTLEIDTTEVPSGAVEQQYRGEDGFCFSAKGGISPYAWSHNSGTFPDGLSFAGDGCLSGIPTTVGTNSFTIRVTDSIGGTTTKTFTQSITGEATQLEILTSGAFPDGTAGVSYSLPIQVIGGKIPYTYSVIAPSTPSGASIDSDGAFTASTNTPGVYAGIVRVTDANGVSQDLEYSLTFISGSTGLALNLGGLTGAVLGQSFVPCVSATGGTPGYTFSATGLDFGLTLDPVTGCFTGYPNQIGSFDVNLSVTDADDETVNSSVFFEVRAFQGEVQLSVNAAGTQAIAIMRRSGLDASSSCTYVLRNNEGQIVESSTFASGAAVRQKRIGSLSAGQEYTLETACQLDGGITAFIGEDVSGTRSVLMEFPKVTGANNVLVEYGISTLNLSQSATCSEGCEIPLPNLERGQIYQIKYTYRNAGNSLIHESPVREKLIN